MTIASSDRLDVLVVGAGPTGLTLAAQLQALGATVRIIDRRLDRVHESRALAVQPRTLEVLRGLGVTEELLERGNDAVWVQLHAAGRVVRVRLFGLGLDDTAFPYLLFVSQADTEQVLGDRLATGGVPVERNVELVGFRTDPVAVTCTPRHRDEQVEPVRVRYLVGCDGAHSTVRRGTGIVLFFPLGRPASWRLLVMHPSLQGRRDPARPSLGDAAHVHSPAGAQGMNTGIQDAWNLSWKLALVSRGTARTALLASYDAERRPVGGFVVRFTDRAYTAVISTNPLVRALRTQLAPRVLPLALRFDRAVADGFRTIAQLNIGYRHSPAVQEGRPALRQGPKAGDRLPDARIARDGQRSWLGEALAWPGFHLLLCGPVGDWHASQLSQLRHRYPDTLAIHHLTREATTPGALHDLDGQVFARLGVDGPAQYLVRPDGHIGYRCGGDDLAGLQRYLARWLPNPTSRPA